MDGACQLLCRCKESRAGIVIIKKKRVCSLRDLLREREGCSRLFMEISLPNNDLEKFSPPPLFFYFMAKEENRWTRCWPSFLLCFFFFPALEMFSIESKS